MFKLTIDNEIELVLLDFLHAQELFKLIIDNKAYLREWLSWVDTTNSLEATKGFIYSVKKKEVYPAYLNPDIFPDILGYHLLY